jgi:long-subunit acyl-CoA synthetase (AMP-forming)
MATRTAVGSTTICAQFQDTARRHAGSVALRTSDGREWTWREYERDVRRAATGLAGLGLLRGDVLACWLTNRPEFHLVDAAAMHLGVASVSVHTNFTIDQAEHVIADAGARVLVTERAYYEQAQRIRAARGTALEYVVVVDAEPMEATAWDELIEGAPQDFDFEHAWPAVREGDVVALIYPSGTTGAPEGVELTHADVVSQARALSQRLGFPEGTRVVSFLPMAHIAERLYAHYFPMFRGWQVTCCPDAGEVADVLADARFFIAFWHACGVPLPELEAIGAKGWVRCAERYAARLDAMYAGNKGISV